MTRPISVNKASVSIRVRVPLSYIEGRLGALAVAAGPHVAAQIHDFVQREKLGYYPALEFFNDRPEIDPGVVAAVEEVGLFVCEFAKTEARNRLWPVFSHVRVTRTQLLALTLPAVRPHQPDALAMLTEHYTPRTVRLDLVLASIERGTREGLEKVATQKVLWWLREAFDAVEVVDARVVPANS